MTKGRTPKTSRAIVKKADTYRAKMEEAGVVIKPTPRSDAASIQRRRAQVWEMICQGVPEAVMGELLKCSTDVVRNDVSYWKTAVGSSLGDMRNDINKVAVDLGTVVKKLDWISENCFMEYSTTDSNQAKNNFLNTAIKAMSLRSKILVDTGFYTKAGVEVNVNVQKKQSFSDRFGEDSPLVILEDPVIKRKCISAAEKLLKRGMNKALPNDEESD